MDEKVEKNFLDLLEKNQKIIHKICRIYSNEEGYKDLFQEIVIQLWKSYSSFNPNSAIEKKEYFSILISNCVAVEKNKR